MNDSIDITLEYLEMMDKYERRFGGEFDGSLYDNDQGLDIMRECLRTGKPYDINKDPNYNPDARY